ncbi:MAG: hypothetical protein MZV70_70655 [Desulfobacterales bacterium]|nr:hypothetical protein [Desulfobacterales bacterium]
MFLTMAFVEGRSLQGPDRRGPPAARRSARRSPSRWPRACKAAHEQGVVHRDVKPANIMLGRRRPGPHHRFRPGLGRRRGRADAAPDRPGHAGLHVARAGPGREDRRSDRRLVVRLHPLRDGGRPAAVRRRERGRRPAASILNDAPPSPPRLRADLPAGLSEVILKCLAKRPDDRYPDFEAVLAALQKRAVMGRATAESADRGPRPAALPSVAVLPFADMSPDKDQDYFGEGLAEELIHALARVQGLRVVARTSAFALKGMKLDVREIGRMLGVGAVARGQRPQVRRPAARHGPAHRRRRTGLHTLVGAVRPGGARRLRHPGRDLAGHRGAPEGHVCSAGEKAALRKRSTADTEALQPVPEGALFRRPGRTPSRYAKALDFFRAAVDKDPGFAQAYAGMAFAFGALGIMNLAPPTEDVAQGQGAPARRPWRSTTTWPRPTPSPPTMAFWYEWDWDAAGRSFDRVLALNPGDAYEHGTRGWFLLNRRRFDESIREIKKALGARPPDAALLRLVGRPALVGGPPRRSPARVRQGHGDRPQPRPGLLPRRHGLLPEGLLDEKPSRPSRRAISCSPRPAGLSGMLGLVSRQARGPGGDGADPRGRPIETQEDGQKHTSSVATRLAGRGAGPSSTWPSSSWTGVMRSVIR